MEAEQEAAAEESKHPPARWEVLKNNKFNTVRVQMKLHRAALVSARLEVLPRSPSFGEQGKQHFPG